MDAIESLVRLPRVACEGAAAVRSAVEWARDGMDFADALHLASARTTGRFATFDRRMIAQARRTADVVVIPI